MRGCERRRPGQRSQAARCQRSWMHAVHVRGELGWGRHRGRAAGGPLLGGREAVRGRVGPRRAAGQHRRHIARQGGHVAHGCRPGISRLFHTCLRCSARSDSRLMPGCARVRRRQGLEGRASCAPSRRSVGTSVMACRCACAAASSPCAAPQRSASSASVAGAASRYRRASSPSRKLPPGAGYRVSNLPLDAGNRVRVAVLARPPGTCRSAHAMLRAGCAVRWSATCWA